MLRRLCPSTLQKAHMSLQAAPKELQSVLERWTGGTVRLERRGAIGRLVLDRPDKNNCLSGQMMLDLRRVVKEELAETRNLSLVVVEGAGKSSFCSGADLGMINELATPYLGSAMFNYMSDTLTALRNSPPLLVANIHGHCLGGATEIATACDLRIAHKNSKMGFMQAMMGIVPSWGGASWLEEAVGRSTALRLMSTAALLTSSEAKQLRWLDEVVESREAAEEWISSLAKFSPPVVQAQKSMLGAVKRGREAEDGIIRSVWGAEDQKKAVEKQLAAVVKKK